MADAIIFRRRGSGGGGTEQNAEMVGGTQSNVGNWWTAIFTSNGWFKAGTAKNNQYYVRAFGGGGSGANGLWSSTQNNYTIGDGYRNGGYAGGGGGLMNNTTITLAPNTNVVVTIGAGQTLRGNYTLMGGTTSFGTYLSAGGGGSGYCDIIQVDFYNANYPIHWKWGWSLYPGWRSLAPWVYQAWGGSGGGTWIQTAWWVSYPGAAASPFNPYNYHMVNSTHRKGWFQVAQFGSGGVWFDHGTSYYDSDNRTHICNGYINTIGGGMYGGSGGIWIAGTYYGNTSVNRAEILKKNGIWYEVDNTLATWQWQTDLGTSTYGGSGSIRGSGTKGSDCTNAGFRYPNGTWMSGTSGGGSYGGGGGGYGGYGGSYGGGGGGLCANGGWYGGGGGGYGINGYGGNNGGGGGGAYGRGGGPGTAPLYGGGGWGGNNGAGANGIVIVQWYSN